MSEVAPVGGLVDLDNIYSINEKKYLISKNFIENSMEIIFVVGENGTILHANKKAIETYGYTYSELLNLSIFDIRNQDIRYLTLKQLDEALKRGIKFKTYHFRKDGYQFPVEVRSIYSSEESKSMVISIIRDISDIEEISKKAAIFSTSLDIFDDAIVVITNELNVSFWSKGAEEKFGYKYDEIIGKSIEVIIIDNKIEEFRNNINFIKNGNIIKNLETIRLHKNGNSIDVSISFSSVYDNDGIITGIVGVYKDISEKNILIEKLKKNNKQLELLRDEADNANKQKSLFLANMSHEIRTPMNGIVATIQLLESTTNGIEQSNYIRILKKSSDILISIINDLLDISKIESSNFKLNDKTFDLKDIINNIYNNLLITGNSKGLEVSCYLDPAIDFQVYGDELRLTQILTNLTSNAVKFTEVGYVSFRVKLISTYKNIEKIEFKITDSGIGIEGSFKERMFLNFSQGDLSTKKEYVGTGLGLAISKQLATLMNGDIWFESIVGKGTTFFFTCEFKKSSKEIPDIGENNSIEVKIPESNSEDDKVILCVEDNLINQEVMESIVKRKGYKYIAAYNGNEALDKLKSNKVDLILMDIQMPELNGFETTKVIRDAELDGNHIPIIATTAYAMHVDRDKCIQAGINEYIVKPFNIERLHEIIEFYLRP